MRDGSETAIQKLSPSSAVQEYALIYVAHQVGNLIQAFESGLRLMQRNDYDAAATKIVADGLNEMLARHAGLTGRLLVLAGVPTAGMPPLRTPPELDQFDPG